MAKKRTWFQVSKHHVLSVTVLLKTQLEKCELQVKVYKCQFAIDPQMVVHVSDI